MDDIREAFAPFVFRRTEEKHLNELPPTQLSTLRVRPTQLMQKLYSSTVEDCAEKKKA